MAKTSSSLPAGGNLLHNTLLGLNDGDYQHLTILEKVNLELISNKQDSLNIDGTGIKYPTVDAVNAGIFAGSTPDATSIIKGKLKLTNDLGGTADLPTINIKTLNSTSIKGSGDIVIDKTFVGLGNADNTSDLNKPISIATQTALDLKENKSEKNQINGYAGLDGSGKIFSSQLPTLAITDTFVVNSQATMLNLTTAEIGDIAVRTDLNKTFILKGLNYSILTDWQELITPTDSVSSVFGRSGAVIANVGDYTTALVTETIDKNYQTDNQKLYNDATSSIQTQLNNRALVSQLNTNSITNNSGVTGGTTTDALNALDAFKANDADVLHKTGDETKSGVLTIADNLNLEDTPEGYTKGFILKNNQPFIHNFYAGTNPLTGRAGKNIFLGVNSGNFNPDNFTYASTMIGFESGMSNKNGYSNTGIGYYALRLNEDGFGNTALGTFVLGNSINGDQNTSVGWHSMLYRTGGSSNSGFGVDVLKENLTGSFNTAFGTNAGANNVSGNFNLFLGYAAGFNELGSSKLYISNSSTAYPLIKGDFSTNSLALGGGVGNKVDIYGAGSIVKTDYRTHANALIPIIYDASNYTFNLNTSGAFTINSTGAAVGLTSGNINKFEVLTASSTGGSGVNGMAVHDGQIQRMALLSGVNTASSYSWIQSSKGGVGLRPIFLNPNGGGVSIGNTTDLGTGTLNVTGNISTIAATTANHVIIKSQHDLKADLVSPILTGNPTVPTAAPGTNNLTIANTNFVTGAIATAVVTARPYKVYTALLTQTGTSAPTEIVLENTTNTTITWTRGAAGDYHATPSIGAFFTANKTAVFVNRGATSTNNNVSTGWVWSSASDVRILTYNNGILTDGCLSGGTVEIRVYP